MKRIVATILTTVALVNAHGYFQTPKARQPGDTYKSTCGEQAFNGMNSDINGNVQMLEQLTQNQDDYDASSCDLWMCKGMQFADNQDNVHQFDLGIDIAMYFEIVAPHTGHANISVLETSSKSVVAANLAQWEKYASTEEPLKDDEQHFTIQLPQDLEGKCSTAGECVLQMFWDAPEVEQTYESCIDFTLGSAKGTSKRNHARDFS